MCGVKCEVCSGMHRSDTALQALLPPAEDLQAVETCLLPALLKEILRFHDVIILQSYSRIRDSPLSESDEDEIESRLSRLPIHGAVAYYKMRGTQIFHMLCKPSLPLLQSLFYDAQWLSKHILI